MMDGFPVIGLFQGVSLGMIRHPRDCKRSLVARIAYHQECSLSGFGIRAYSERFFRNPGAWEIIMPLCRISVLCCM